MSSGQQDTTEKAATPTLCAAGCGFYSNVGTAGLCSRCFASRRDEEAREKGEIKAATSAVEALLNKAPAPVAPALPEASTSAPAPVVEAPAAAVASPAPQEPPKPSSTRCLTCNKKVGLTGFACKCQPDAVFCSHHRYAEAHNCTFDYKAAQRQQLADNNPVVQASKLTRLV